MPEICVFLDIIR